MVIGFVPFLLKSRLTIEWIHIITTGGKEPCLMTDSVPQPDTKDTPHTEISTLVAQAQQDPAAFGPLYDHYIQPIYRYLYSRVANTQEAQDLAAQTFLSALETLPRYRDKGYFSAWLFRIARNKVMDHYRKQKHETDWDLPENQGVNPDLLSQVIQSQDVQLLSQLIGILAEADQELIRLRYVAELSFAEIAALLGKKEDAVKKNLYRLLARLESQMEAQND